MAEVLSVKQALTSMLDTKVDVKEVQSALNDCQADLAEQLSQFKQKIGDKLREQEIGLNRLIDRKVDHKDLQGVVDDKMDRQEAMNLFAPNNELHTLKMQSDDVVRLVEEKLESEKFTKFESSIEERVADINKQLSRKSNIKDVCALLDMKANTAEVNKALDEIHEEMDKVVVTKAELNDAL